MSNLLCRRCGREGTRDFEMLVTTRPDGTETGVIFIVCRNEIACQRRLSRAKRVRQERGLPAQQHLEIDPYGTLFFASKITPCPLCSGTIYPTMTVIQTSWTKRVLIATGPEPEDRKEVVERGPAAAVHLECAKRNGIRVDWTEKRVLGDLHQIIASIPKRKLVRTGHGYI